MIYNICHVRRNGIWVVGDLYDVKAGELFHLFSAHSDLPLKDRNGYVDQFAIEDARSCEPEGNCSVVCETSV